MGEYRVKVGGRTYSFFGDIPPTEKEIDAGVATADAQLARRKTISTYNPTTQMSALMAEERPNMLKATLEEGAKPVPKDWVRRYKQLAAFGLKGAAAAAQGIEGAVSAPIVSMQRGQFNPADIAKTTLESATGRAPTELGDILRNVGAPEMVAQAGGLVTSAFLPGFKQAKEVAGTLRKAGSKLVTGTKNAIVSGIAKPHLTLLSRAESEAVEHGLKKKFSFVKLGESPEQIKENLTKGVDKIREAAKYVKRRAGRFQAKMLRQHGDDLVSVGDTVSKTRTVAAKSNLYIKGATGEILEDAHRNIQLNPIPGNAKLHRVLNEVESAAQAQNGQLTVNQIKGFQKRIRSIAKEERYREVYAVANELDSNLSKATHQIEGMKNADKLYAMASEALEGSETKGTVGVAPLYTPSKRGGTPAEKYFGLEPKAKTALENLEGMRLPEKKRFLENLKDVVDAYEFESYKPQAGISLLGLGASLAKPSMIPAVAGAVALSSKRASAIFYKTLLGGLKGTPVQDAVMELITQGVIDPAIVRGAREIIMNSTKE